MRLAGAAGLVKPSQVANSRAVCCSAKSTSQAGQRGEPAVQVPTLGLFLLAPFSPSSKGDAVDDGAYNERPDLKRAMRIGNCEWMCVIVIQWVSSTRVTKMRLMAKRTLKRVRSGRAAGSNRMT